MKLGKKFWIGLTVVLLCLAASGEGLAAPFSLVAAGLRWLSLSGSVGNVIAIVLYSAVCLSPLALVRRRREDWLLLLCSGALFYVLYGFINPGTLPTALRNDVGMLICAGVVYNILITWGVLRLLKASNTLETAQVYGALRIFLTIGGISLVLLGVIGGFRELGETIREIENANTMPGLDLMPTFTFAALGWIVDSVEYGLDAVVVLWGVRLLQEVEADPYSEACAVAGERITHWCKWAIGIIVLMNMALNLGQVALASALHHIDATLRIPVFSLGLVFLTLALTRLLVQGKALKDDNDLFI